MAEKWQKSGAPKPMTRERENVKMVPSQTGTGRK